MATADSKGKSKARVQVNMIDGTGKTQMLYLSCGHTKMVDPVLRFTCGDETHCDYCIAKIDAESDGITEAKTTTDLINVWTRTGGHSPSEEMLFDMVVDLMKKVKKDHRHCVVCGQDAHIMESGGGFGSRWVCEDHKRKIKVQHLQPLQPPIMQREKAERAAKALLNFHSDADTGLDWKERVRLLESERDALAAQIKGMNEAVRCNLCNAEALPMHVPSCDCVHAHKREDRQPIHEPFISVVNELAQTIILMTNKCPDWAYEEMYATIRRKFYPAMRS